MRARAPRYRIVYSYADGRRRRGAPYTWAGLLVVLRKQRPRQSCRRHVERAA